MRRPHRFHICCILGIGLVCLLFSPLRSQALERDTPRASFPQAEQNVLDGRTSLKGLDCDARLVKPTLGFDFRFNGRLVVSVPFKQLDSSGNELTFSARLRSRSGRKQPALFRHVYPSPEREEVAGARRIQAMLYLAVGEGDFRLDWLMQDQNGRGCSGRRRFKTRLKGPERKVRMRIEPGAAIFSAGEEFGFETLAPDPTQGRPLYLKILLNLPPFKDYGRRLYRLDVFRVMSILREIAIHPRVGKIDLVAFNLKDQRTIYTQRGDDFLDYPAFYHALRGLENDLVRADTLRKGADTEFLADLLETEFENSRDVDAVVLVGPRLETRRKLKPEKVATALRKPPATFYLRYRFRRAGAGWGDAITPFVDAVDGELFSIYRPIDLWRSVEKMIREIDGQ